MPKLSQEVRQLVETSDGYATDINQVAGLLGLKVFAASLPEGVSGKIVRDDSYGSASGFVIFVDRDESNHRQRFTAAHEIGHFELHKDFIGDSLSDNYLYRSDSLSDKKEVEANKYAAALLMPYVKIQKAITEGFNTVESLAKQFEVSETAMAIRVGMPT